MNTGTQRSGATPQGVRTATTPGSGKLEPKKDMVRIMAAHSIPYIATACAAYPLDLFQKFQRARSIYGTRYIHILCPCPPGWGYEPEELIQVGKQAVRSGIFPLFEIENGRLRLSPESRRESAYDVETYLRAQRRFREFTAHEIEQVGQQARAKAATPVHAAIEREGKAGGSISGLSRQCRFAPGAEDDSPGRVKSGVFLGGRFCAFVPCRYSAPVGLQLVAKGVSPWYRKRNTN